MRKNKLQTSGNTIVSNETVSIKCSSSSLHEFKSGLDMVDFAANFTIHATKIGFKNSTFYLESVVLESRSSTNSLVSIVRYFHLCRISDLLSIYR